MTNRLCKRCGRCYLDPVVYIINPGPGLCCKCRFEVYKKVVTIVGDLLHGK